MLDSITAILLILSLVLQATVIALAVRSAMLKRDLQRLPVRWAWALAAVGLILLGVHRALILLNGRGGTQPGISYELLLDGLILLGTSACLTIAVLSLFQSLNQAKAASQRQREALAAVYQVGLAAASTLGLEQVLQQVYEQVSRLMHLDAFCLALYDPVTDDLRMEMIIEDGRRRPKFTIKASDGNGLTAWVVRSRQILRISDLEAERERFPTISWPTSPVTIHSWLGLPLMVQDRVVGVLSVQSRRANAFTTDHEQLLTTIAAEAAIAIENARLHQDLEASQERYRILIESAKDAILIGSEEDDILEVNMQACKLLGYSRQELLNMKVPDLQAPEVRGRLGDVIKSELARSDQVFETLVLHRNGTRIPVEVSIARIGSNGKRPALAIIRDITERKRAEAALRESEQRYRALFAAAQRQAQELELLDRVRTAIGRAPDLSSVFRTVVEAIAQTLGYRFTSLYLLEGDTLVLQHQVGCDQAATHIPITQGIEGRVARTGRPVLLQDVRTDPEITPCMDGIVSKVCVPFFDDGQITGTLSVETTGDTRLTEADLQVMTALCEHVGIAVTNARLYQQARRRLQEVSIIQAVALAGAAGRPFDDIVAEATERLSRLWDSHHLGFLFPDETGALRAHSSYRGLSPQVKDSLRMLPGQGLTGWVFQTGQPIVVPDIRQDPHYFETDAATCSEMDAPLVVGNRVIGVVNVESTRPNAFSAEDLRLLSALAGQLAIILDNAQAHRDLSDRARQLQDAYYELAEAEQLKEQLVQNISHELRTPLTYIRGFAELMLIEAFGPMPKELREPIEMIFQKTQTITKLIERIVALQAMNSLSLSFEPLRLGKLLQEAVERWKLAAQLAGVQINLELPADLPLLAGDRRYLSEAFDNLLGNAIKFSPKGGHVTIRAHGETELVQIDLTDNGIGIPQDKLSRVFDRFYQVDGSTTRHFGGAGVGLALVRQIVQAHGGHVWAESPGPGQGSTFHLILPTAPAGGK